MRRSASKQLCAARTLGRPRPHDRLRPPRPDDRPYDLIITNARIVDSTRNPYYYLEFGIRGGRIGTIAPLGALAEVTT